MEVKALNFTPININDKRNAVYYYLSFLVWPFGVMIDAIIHWERPYSKNVFWLFCIFFGLTFIIAKEGGADSDRYAQLFTQYAHSGMSMRELWSSFYASGSDYIDIASPLITYFASRLTDNPVFLFTVFGLIFGYFYSRNIWYVIGRLDVKPTGIAILFILTFAMINPIWNINGFRFNTAAQIFLFGSLPYLFEGNIKRLIWAAASLFVHFSFLSPVAILFLFVIFKNRPNIYMAFFILTSFLKEIDLDAVKSALSFLPGVFQSRVEGYTNIEYAQGLNDLRQSVSWFIPLSEKCLTWVTYALTLFIYFFNRPLLSNRQDLNTLFSFSLLLYGFANIFSLVPSGGRFIVLANAFIFVFFTIYISSTLPNKALSILYSLSMPLLLLYCLVSLRLGMDFFGLTTVIGNPIYAILHSETVPIIEGIKGLL